MLTEWRWGQNLKCWPLIVLIIKEYGYRSSFSFNRSWVLWILPVWTMYKLSLYSFLFFYSFTFNLKTKIHTYDHRRERKSYKTQYTYCVCVCVCVCVRVCVCACTCALDRRLQTRSTCCDSGPQMCFVWLAQCWKNWVGMHTPVSIGLDFLTPRVFIIYNSGCRRWWGLGPVD